MQADLVLRPRMCKLVLLQKILVHLRACFSHGISWQTRARASMPTILSTFQTSAHTPRSVHGRWFYRNTLTVAQFDDLITVHAGGNSPPFPFRDVYDYYAYAASHRVLGNVRIPFLAINSDDDPLVKHLPMYETDNEWVVLVVTRGGGHISWFEATGNRYRRWMPQPALEWFKATAEKIEVPRRVVRDIKMVDGWLVESGRAHLGCRDIGDGGRIDRVMKQKGILAGL